MAWYSIVHVQKHGIIVVHVRDYNDTTKVIFI